MYMRILKLGRVLNITGKRLRVGAFDRKNGIWEVSYHFGIIPFHGFLPVPEVNSRMELY